MKLSLTAIVVLLTLFSTFECNPLPLPPPPPLSTKYEISGEIVPSSSSSLTSQVIIPNINSSIMAEIAPENYEQIANPSESPLAGVFQPVGQFIDRIFLTPAYQLVKPRPVNRIPFSLTVGNQRDGGGVAVWNDMKDNNQKYVS